MSDQLQQILNLITSTQNQIDRLQTPQAINRVLLQTLNEIKLLCLREKTEHKEVREDGQQ